MNNWLDRFFDNSWLRIARHNSTTGRLQVNGSDIDPYEYTWAEFIFLTASDFAGVNVRVTNRHQDSRGVGGVLFVGGATWTVLNGGHVYYSTLAAAIAEVPAASWSGMRIFPGDIGAPMQSDGTSYLIDGGEAVISRSAVAQRVISPNAAITWTAADNGSGKVRLTSSGAHGLTTAICVTAGQTYLSATATQNGWTANTLHLINTIVDPTTIDLNTTWASQGVPVFALAGTAFVIKTLTIPPMTPDGRLELDVTWGSTDGGSSKQPYVWFGAAGSGTGGTVYYAPAAIVTGRTAIRPAPIVIQNRGAVASQVAAIPSVVQSLIDVSNTVQTTSSVTTSTGTEINIGSLMAAANAPIWIERYTLKMGT